MIPQFIAVSPILKIDLISLLFCWERRARALRYLQKTIDKWPNELHREREKLKQTKRQDKQKKKEERLSGGSRSFEDMLAYVDENGVLHTTPQDVKPKEEIDVSQIEISVPRQSEIEEEEPMSGRVEYFTASKGYGFIKDAAGSEKYFFHITNAPAGIAEGDRVTFELERGTRGMNAVRIVISNK